MGDRLDLIKSLDSRARRRAERREFFKAALSGAAVVAGASGLFYADDALAQAKPTDSDILNLLLNFEYLEAQFFSYAVNGIGLPANMLDGSGTQGAVIAGQKVAFSDPVVSAFAQEIAKDEMAHVALLRAQLGSARVAQPAIDIGGTNPNGAFSKIAQTAGLVAAGTVFNPYSSDENFLLGAYILEDVGVTAYKGVTPLITSKVFLDVVGGLLAAESYHSALIRAEVYIRGLATPSLRTATDAISKVRDRLDAGATSSYVDDDPETGKSFSDDRGVSRSQAFENYASNIALININGLIYSRSTGQVLNVLYLNRIGVTMGGFFPAGVNGVIRAGNNNPD